MLKYYVYNIISVLLYIYLHMHHNILYWRSLKFMRCTGSLCHFNEFVFFVSGDEDAVVYRIA